MWSVAASNWARAAANARAPEDGAACALTVCILASTRVDRLALSPKARVSTRTKPWMHVNRT